MIFLADESVDVAIVQRIRLEGYHVDSVMEMEPGISDDQVLAQAR